MVDRVSLPTAPASLPGASPPGEGRILAGALLVAAVLHLVALALPLPARRTAPPRPVAVPQRPEIHFFRPHAPTTERPRALEQPRVVPRRFVPGAETVDLEPVEEAFAAPPSLEADVLDDFDIPSPPAVPPPAPAILESDAPGLRPPLPAYRVEPAYPALARLARRGGRVLLRAVIDEGGNVGNLEVIQAPDPDLGFADAALEAVRGWRYIPGEIRGRAVPVRLTVEVTFTLD